MDEHDRLVNSIARRVAYLYSKKRPFRIYHGSTNSTRSTTFSDDTSINTSMLNRILSIDPEARTCLVESNVPMDALVAATLPLGVMPSTVPEFPGITVGGAFSGTGGESTSFRQGFFDQSVSWVEMILADGNIVTASSSRLPRLFYGAAGTFGTLGIVTMLEIRLLAAKPYVELTYTPIINFADAQQKMTDFSTGSPPVDFIDALMFSETSGVVCSGILVNIQDYAIGSRPGIASFSKPWDQWFYIHAQSVISKDSIEKELVPLTKYLFRYDRGAFWAGRFVFDWFGVPFNRLTRYLADWLMSTRILYHGLHASGLGAHYIIQDCCLPESTAGEFASWLHNNYHIYPLWLCPVKQNARISMNPHIPSTSHCGRTTEEAMLNIGVWGTCPRDRDRISCNRQLEAKVQSLLGMKWLYADCFYTEQEFWSIYNHEWYEKLRLEYKASTLPSVYQKIRTRERPLPWSPLSLHAPIEVISGKKTLGDVWHGLWSVWPLAGFKAVASALRGEEYLKRKLD